MRNLKLFLVALTLVGTYAYFARPTQETFVNNNVPSELLENKKGVERQLIIRDFYLRTGQFDRAKSAQSVIELMDDNWGSYPSDWHGKLKLTQY